MTGFRKTKRRFFQSLTTPIDFFKTEKKGIKGKHPGFLNTVAYSVLLSLTISSLHHLLQSIFYKRRYLVTDIYFTLWLLIAILLYFHSTINCQSCILPIEVIVIYRLIESISREFWVVFYRKERLTSSSRVLVLVFINYITVTALFGFLNQNGITGYKKALSISSTFSFNIQSTQELEVIQAIYCLIFMIVIISIFIGRATTK